MTLNYRRLFGDNEPREKGWGALMSRLNVGISPSASRATKRPLLVILALSAPPPSFGTLSANDTEQSPRTDHFGPPQQQQREDQPRGAAVDALTQDKHISDTPRGGEQ